MKYYYQIKRKQIFFIEHTKTNRQATSEFRLIGSREIFPFYTLSKLKEDKGLLVVTNLA